MVALRGLLFALVTWGITLVVSLIVVGIITLIYKTVSRGKAKETEAK